MKVGERANRPTLNNLSFICIIREGMEVRELKDGKRNC